MAAISKMMSVTSWSASHTNCRNVLAFLGGMKFCPKTCRLFSRSVGFPDKPGEGRDGDGNKPPLPARSSSLPAQRGCRARLLSLHGAGSTQGPVRAG